MLPQGVHHPADVSMHKGITADVEFPVLLSFSRVLRTPD